MTTCKHLDYSESSITSGKATAATGGRASFFQGSKSRDFGALPAGAYCAAEIALVAEQLSPQTSRTGTAMQHLSGLLTSIKYQVVLVSHIHLRPTYVGPTQRHRPPTDTEVGAESGDPQPHRETTQRFNTGEWQAVVPHSQLFRP